MFMGVTELTVVNIISRNITTKNLVSSTCKLVNINIDVFLGT